MCVSEGINCFLLFREHATAWCFLRPEDHLSRSSRQFIQTPPSLLPLPLFPLVKGKLLWRGALSWLCEKPRADSSRPSFITELNLFVCLFFSSFCCFCCRHRRCCCFWRAAAWMDITSTPIIHGAYSFSLAVFKFESQREWTIRWRNLTRGIFVVRCKLGLQLRSRWG